MESERKYPIWYYAANRGLDVASVLEVAGKLGIDTNGLTESEIRSVVSEITQTDSTRDNIIKDDLTILFKSQELLIRDKEIEGERLLVAKGKYFILERDERMHADYYRLPDVDGEPVRGDWWPIQDVVAMVLPFFEERNKKGDEYGKETREFRRMLSVIAAKEKPPTQKRKRSGKNGRSSAVFFDSKLLEHLLDNADDIGYMLHDTEGRPRVKGVARRRQKQADSDQEGTTDITERKVSIAAIMHILAKQKAKVEDMRVNGYIEGELSNPDSIVYRFFTETLGEGVEVSGTEIGEDRESGTAAILKRYIAYGEFRFEDDAPKVYAWLSKAIGEYDENGVVFYLKAIQKALGTVKSQEIEDAQLDVNGRKPDAKRASKNWEKIAKAMEYVQASKWASTRQIDAYELLSDLIKDIASDPSRYTDVSFSLVPSGLWGLGKIVGKNGRPIHSHQDFRTKYIGAANYVIEAEEELGQIIRDVYGRLTEDEKISSELHTHIYNSMTPGELDSLRKLGRPDVQLITPIYKQNIVELWVRAFGSTLAGKS